MPPTTGEILAALAFLGKHALLLAALAATAYAPGRALAGGLPFEGRLERTAVSTALGLALLSQVAFFLALAGLLRWWALLAAAAFLHLLGRGAWRELGREVRATPRPAARRVFPFAALGATSLLPIFALPLYPPTAFDSTMYHLSYAKAFALEGGLAFLPNLRYPVFPQSGELLFSVMWIFGGDIASQLVSCLATLATAGLLLAWGWSLVSPAAGWIAAAVWLGNPIVVFLAGTAYVEPLLVLFAAGAAYAALRWRTSGRAGWAAVSGALAGAAGAVKYPGLFFPAALLLLVAARAGRDGKGIRPPLLFAMAALVLLLPTYARLAVETGNPVFPFLPRVFGSNQWELTGYWKGQSGEGLTSAPDFDPRRPEDYPKAVVSLARTPWDAVFDRGRWGRQPPISPVYVLALPLVLAAATGDRGVRAIFLFSLAYMAACLALPRDTRFLLPLLPFWSLAAALSLVRAAPRLGRVGRLRLAAPLLSALLFLPGWLYALRIVERAGPLPTDARGRELYLARSLPLYPAIAFLNRSVGSSYVAYGFFSERMTYFADGVLWGDWFGPGAYRRMIPALSNGEALQAELRRLGARFLIVPDGRGLRLPEDTVFRRGFRQVYADGKARIYEVSPVISSEAKGSERGGSQTRVGDGYPLTPALSRRERE